MGRTKKVLIFGAGGRVGLGLVNALLRQAVDIVAVDFISSLRLTEKIARVSIDARLSNAGHVDIARPVSIHGDVDVLDVPKVTELIAREAPDIVVNYAIPFTWDAAKQLPNYEQISRARLGSFASLG